MMNIVVLKALDAHWLGKYAHAGRTHPGFLRGTAVRLCAQPRYQGVTTSLQEMGKRPVPWHFIAVLSERDNHLNRGIVGMLMRGGERRRGHRFQ